MSGGERRASEIKSSLVAFAYGGYDLRMHWSELIRGKKKRRSIYAIRMCLLFDERESPKRKAKGDNTNRLDGGKRKVQRLTEHSTEHTA
jgi:hypothetical protein